MNVKRRKKIKLYIKKRKKDMSLEKSDILFFFLFSFLCACRHKKKENGKTRRSSSLMSLFSWRDQVMKRENRKSIRSSTNKNTSLIMISFLFSLILSSRECLHTCSFSFVKEENERACYFSFMLVLNVLFFIKERKCEGLKAHRSLLFSYLISLIKGLSLRN